MESTGLYHVLYADDIRLDSLAAQIYGKVAENLTEDEQLETGKKSLTTLGVEVIGHQRENAQNTTTTQSTSYSFRDARYFEVLYDMGIDANKNEVLNENIIDGKIHVVKGKLKVYGTSVINPTIEVVRAIAPYVASPYLGQQGIKNKNDLKDFNKMLDAILKIPIPTAFHLTLSDDKVIIGSLDENSMRLNMSDMMLLFKGQLPFEWTVIGYVYPNEERSQPQNFFPENMDFSSITQIVADFGAYLTPKSDAIMLPILIMR